MLFRVFELKPERVGQVIKGFNSNGRSYQSILSGTQGESYSVIVGTRDRNPTARTKDKIRRSIIEAWENLFGSEGNREIYGKIEITPPPYGIAIVPDPVPPAGDIELPMMYSDHYYIVFALLESETTISDEEERLTHEELMQMIMTQYSGVNPKPRIALVTLYNCSVQILRGPGSKIEKPKPSRTDYTRR